MKGNRTFTGRISGDGGALGTATPEMVEARARELALIAGRDPKNFTQTDLDQAEEELTGNSAQEDYSADDPRQSLSDKTDATPAGSGNFAEQLVQEGVDEATHDTMLAGATTETRQNS